MSLDNVGKIVGYAATAVVLSGYFWQESKKSEKRANKTLTRLLSSQK